MKVTVNKDGCIECGLCASICPAVFTIDQEGKAESIPGEIEKTLEEDCNEAILSCPVSVISKQE